MRNRFGWTLSLTAALAGFGTLAHTSTSQAQSAAPNSIGADLALAIPVGDWGDAAGVGFGALLSYQHSLDDQLGITGRLGFITHGEKTTSLGVGSATTTFSEIPIYGGIKYRFSPDENSLFFAGEAGLTMFRGEACVDVDLGLGGGSQEVCGDSSETKLGAIVAVGYDLGAVDLRAGVWLPSVGDAGDLMAVLVTAGYKFASF